MPSLSSEIVLGTVAMEVTSVIEGIKHFRACQVGNKFFDNFTLLVFGRVQNTALLHNSTDRDPNQDTDWFHY